MTVLVIVWLFGIGTKRISGNIFTLALFLYTCSIVVSALFSPYITILDSWIVRNWFLHIVFFIILMTSVKTERNLKIILAGFTITYFIVMAHTYWVYLQGRATVSMGVVRLSGVTIRGGEETFRDPNYYATALVCALPMVFSLLVLCKRYWHYLFVLGYVLLTARNVMLSGSRTALIMLVALAVLPVLFSRYRFYLIPLLFVALPVGWMVMPEQMQNRYRTIWDPTVERAVGMGGAGASMQGRIAGVYTGMRLWETHPFTGAGPGTTVLLFRAATHSLPGQLAGETGTLGIVTFLLMLSCFGINHYHNWKNYKYLREKNLGKEGLYCWRVSIVVMYAIGMALLTGIGLHNAFAYQWVWFGAFQALATILMQEKVNAAMQGKLLPSLPVRSGA